MINKPEIRESRSGDTPGIEQLYRDAFPSEDLLPLVRDLLDFGPSVISFVGVHENLIVGHIGFTLCHVGQEADKVGLLAPLAVKPTLHNQGIGSALVQSGFTQLKNSKIGCIFVLGDPAYYGRFGFKAEDKVVPPYPLPTEWHGAWQSFYQCDEEMPYVGKLSVPELWRQKSLWTT